MLQPRDGLIVIVGLTPELAGSERLLAAFQDGDDLLVPIEVDRASNGPLLVADEVFVHDGTGMTRRPVVGRRTLSPAERLQLARAAPAMLGSSLELLRLGAAQPAVTTPSS